MGRRRNYLATLVLSVSALMLVSVGTAGAAAPCSKKGSRTLAKNSVMRIYMVAQGGLYGNDTIYGCIYKFNRSHKLETNNNPMGFSIQPIAVTRGDFVAFADSDGFENGAVELWNLRTGKNRLNTPVVSPPVGSDANPEVSQIVANGRGSIAWIENDDNLPPSVPTLVRAFDQGGLRQLDAGFGINTGSLQMASNGLSVSWVDNNVRESANVSP